MSLTAVQTGAARDIEVFAISGVTYFAVANHAAPDGTLQTASPLYRIECSNEALVQAHDSSDVFAVHLHQSFDTIGGMLPVVEGAQACVSRYV